MDISKDKKYNKMIIRYGKDVKAVKSALDPDDTFYYYKDKHIATLQMSCKNGQVGISFKFTDEFLNDENI